MIFKVLLYGLDFGGQLPLSDAVSVESKTDVENRPDFRVQKMSLRYEWGAVDPIVCATGIKIYLKSYMLLEIFGT
jgi:hypothetical protein